MWTEIEFQAIRRQHQSPQTMANHQLTCALGSDCMLHYCVGGALMTGGGAAPLYFPSTKMLARWLYAQNPALISDRSGEAAKGIISANDACQFEGAWLIAHEALVEKGWKED